MLMAKGEDGRRRLATRTKKNQGPFYCPECQDQVILKKGEIVIHHYSHRAKSRCAYAHESQLHLRIKLQVAAALRKAGHKRRIEAVRGDQRADVLWKHPEGLIAIEVQVTKLPWEEVRRRTREWNDKDCAVLWLLPPPIPRASKKPRDTYATSPFERYLHTLYVGRVYYWHDPYFVPVHFETRSTQDRYGRTHWPRCNRLVEVGEWLEPDDFQIIERPAWQAPRYSLPQCQLAFDKLDDDKKTFKHFKSGLQPLRQETWQDKPGNDWTERVTISERPGGGTNIIHTGIDPSERPFVEAEEADEDDDQIILRYYR